MSGALLHGEKVRQTGEKCKGEGHSGMDCWKGGVAPGNWKRPGWGRPPVSIRHINGRDGEI